jgi:hypothetical protein
VTGITSLLLKAAYIRSSLAGKALVIGSQIVSGYQDPRIALLVDPMTAFAEVIGNTHES